MTTKLFIFFLLFLCSTTVAITAELETEQEDTIKLHVIYSEKIQAIMQRLSISVYEEKLTMDQINELFDNASELLLAAKNLTQALPGIELTVPEKSIFENVARQLQIEANNLGYMTQNNDKEGIEIVYKRINETCIACHELFRF
jgi:cytochrome c556